MAFFDLSPDALRTYNPPEKAPRDFDAFWKKTLAETAATGPANPHFVQVADDFYQAFDVYDVTFAGFMGHPIKGWFLEPAGNDEPRPCVVTFHGYGGGRASPLDNLAPLVAGFSHFVMDTRGQGSGWGLGATPDHVGSGPQFSGFMTKGIESPDTYYYRRVYVDAVRAVEAAAAHPRVDPARIAVTGGSQGGGLSLAAAGLLGSRVKLCMPDVPFLCHFRRVISMVDSYPYQEIASYLRAHRGKAEDVYRTLSYFDCIHLAPKIKARTLMSVALMDMVCPPSTGYAAFNRIKAPKDMRIYDFNGHEGGGSVQVEERLRFAKKWL